MRAVGVVALSYLVGAVPFSNLLARGARGVDLRTYGTKTVSATSLYRVAGFAPMALGGVLDIAKGALGPALAGPSSHPVAAALGAGAAIAGHNWSVFLKGAGGRGISPALGATAVAAWPGTVVLTAGLVAGRLARQTALGCFVAIVLLVPVLALTRGVPGIWLGCAVVIPLLAKRLAGNERVASGRGAHVWVQRLVFDREPAAA